jgi:hypothetical protein
MSGTERPAKRARLEADKRRDVLAKVQDQYADIDFTRFQKAVDADETGEATPYRFVLVRPTETALVKDWRRMTGSPSQEQRCATQGEPVQAMPPRCPCLALISTWVAGACCTIDQFDSKL